MDKPTTRIEVQPERDGGWSVARNRIVDGYFSELEAANDYASACARRARRAGMAVDLMVWPGERQPETAA